MSEYIRGIEDTLEFILVLIKECKDLKELREKVKDMLSDIIEGKYEKLKKMFKHAFLFRTFIYFIVLEID